MATEDEIIRRRLLIDGDGTGDDKRITTLLKTFIKWSVTDNDEDDRALTYQKILAQLAQCEYSMTKHHLAYEMNTKERLNYERLYKEIENQMVDAREEIAACKEELRQARIVRKNKQEYDALAKVIDAQPERKQLQKEIEGIQRELSVLDEEQGRLVQKLELRQKQFHTLVYSIQLLQQILLADGEPEPSPTVEPERVPEVVEVMDLTTA